MLKKFEVQKQEMLQILDQDGIIVNKSLEPKISKDNLLNIYQTMILGRIADIKALQFQRQGRMLTYAPNRGQEAAQIGPMSAVNKADWLVPSFRELNAMLFHGVTLEQLYLYWYGNEWGSHFNKDVNVLPVNITIGAQISHAAGLAYASNLLNKKQTAIAFIGDGGTSHGEFHEGLNFCGVYNLPVIVVIQNNQWAISTPRAKATKAETLAQKAIAYGIPGIQVDGNDVLAMHVATLDALKRAQKGEGPTLIEAITYRMGPHTSSDDPTIYRDNEEVKLWEAKDPITRFKKYLIDKNIWSEEQDDQLTKETTEFILETFKKVEQTGLASLEDVFNYTYESLSLNLKEQLSDYKDYLEKEVK